MGRAEGEAHLSAKVSSGGPCLGSIPWSAGTPALQPLWALPGSIWGGCQEGERRRWGRFLAGAVDR